MVGRIHGLELFGPDPMAATGASQTSSGRFEV
jgi:hypothetical protein